MSGETLYGFGANPTPLSHRQRMERRRKGRPVPSNSNKEIERVHTLMDKHRVAIKHHVMSAAEAKRRNATIKDLGLAWCEGRAPLTPLKGTVLSFAR